MKVYIYTYFPQKVYTSRELRKNFVGEWFIEVEPPHTDAKHMRPH